MSIPERFLGNCPRNVSKDAKYGVRTRNGRSVVGLIYCVDEDERWRMTTGDHPDLVEMVNAVKTRYGDGLNGPFYINEYKQVIVPVGPSADYYFAGTYDQPLRFEFEGKTISGEPFNLDGKPLQPGDVWDGPHAGIPYVLTASGDDVYYRTNPRPDVEKRIRLSKQRDPDSARRVAKLLSAFKGNGGGRFYVNEFGCVFSPITADKKLQYVYFGCIDLDSWFPDPMAVAAS